MSNAESVARAFGKAHKVGDSWQCLCPIHENQFSNPSLGVTDNPDGGVVFNCFRGCDWKDIQREAENRGLISRFEPKVKMENNLNGASSHSDSRKETYSYIQEDGHVRFYIKKYVNNLGKKSFFPYHINSQGESIKGISGVARIPYNLPALIKAETIYLTEGEKDADALNKKGLVATTNALGASAWRSEYDPYFKDKKVIICQDNDDAGRERTKTLTLHLKNLVAELWLFEPPGVGEKGDVYDWIASGGVPSEILSSSKLIIKNQKKEKPTAFIASEWLQVDPIEPIPIVPGVFDAGDKVVLIGQSKTRKSFFIMQMAFSIAANKKFIGFKTLPKKVLMIQIEIRKDRYHARCKRLFERMDLEPCELENLILVNARGYGSTAEDIKELIKELVDTHKPDVVFIDPLYKLIEGDESKSEEIKPILKFFDSLAETSKAAIVYVHHDKKGVSGDQQVIDRGAGSGVLARDFDSAIFLTPHKDKKDHLVIDLITRNHSQTEPFSIEWKDNGFDYSVASPDKQTQRSLNAKKASLKELLDKAKQFIKAELAFGKSESYSIKFFKDKLEDIGIPNKKLTSTIEQLEQDGILEIRTRKAKKGEPSKVVYLLGVPDEPIEEEKTEFQDALSDYEEGF